MEDRIRLILVLVLVLIAVSIANGTELSREVLASDVLAKIKAGQPAEFDNCSIVGDLNLSLLKIDERVHFNNTLFLNAANFEATTFNSTAYFRYSEFANANFKGTTFCEDTYFEDAVFDWADFIEAKFCRNVDFIGAKFNGTAYTWADFSGATFCMNADFSEATFNRADFSGATFCRDNEFDEVDFNGATFSRDADFGEAKFGGFTYFRRAKFSENANLREAKFCGVTPFSGYADFSGANFSGKADFLKAIFNAAEFIGATFNGVTPFIGATFSWDAEFSKVTFSGNAFFSEVKFNRTANFSEAKFRENTPFSRVAFRGYFFGWDDIKNSLTCDKATYSEMISNFKNHGQFYEANDCYYFSRLHYMKDPFDYLAYITCGFGVKWQQTIYFGIFWLILFGLLYFSMIVIYEGFNKKVIVKQLIDAFGLSTVVLLSVPSELYFNKADTYKQYLKEIKYNLPILERIIGWIVLILFINTLSRVMLPSIP